MLMMLPNKITIQWHLTDQCNYRCIHCYQDQYQDGGGDYTVLLCYLDKIESFVKQLSGENRIKAHLNLTGGEPFIKAGFLDLLAEINRRGIFSVGILSNGFLLPENDLLKLKDLKPQFIQISLDGNEALNDEIRGKGSYRQIINAIKTYKRLGISVLISFTAHAQNYKEFPEVVKIAHRHGVSKVWTDRYLPKDENDPLQLTTEQAKEYFQIIAKAQRPRYVEWFSKTIVSSNRSLQFLAGGGKPYKCTAGTTLLALLPNGNIMPCRRLPVVIGNINYDNLLDVYQNNDTLKNLRLTSNSHSECLTCYYKTSCNGGLKCLSYAIHKDYSKKDPNCWI